MADAGLEAAAVAAVALCTAMAHKTAATASSVSLGTDAMICGNLRLEAHAAATRLPADVAAVPAGVGGFHSVSGPPRQVGTALDCRAMDLRALAGIRVVVDGGGLLEQRVVLLRAGGLVAWAAAFIRSDHAEGVLFKLRAEVA